jgi:hypothetical protein
MGETEKYKIGRLTYIQSELTLKKDYQLIELYNQLMKGPLKDEEIRLKDLQIMLTRHNRLEQFFKIILKPKYDFNYLFSFRWILYALGRVNIANIPNSLLRKIFEDFFLFNKPLITKLTGLGNILELMADQPISPQTEPVSQYGKQ